MKTLEEIASFAKRRGFVYPSSEIYGGLANAYDYGPMGVELLRNIKNLWWEEFITKRADIVGIDSSIILHPETWVASGHVGSFTDPMVEDKKTHKRYRADHLIEKNLPEGSDIVVENMSVSEMNDFLIKNKIKSPDGNEISDVKDFNILFETSIGAVSGEKSVAYLRGETAQGIFTNFKQVLDTTRVKLPFGIGQIGKSFRNEITLGQFVFRTLEFEQAEIEYFFDPKETNWEDLMNLLKQDMWTFVSKTLGIKEENLKWRRHSDSERSHYSRDTYDLDYHFPFGFKELWGIAYRTDYDLKAQMNHSKKSLEYTNNLTNEKIIPHVIEPAVGINRLFLMVLCDALTEENDRLFLKIKPKLAPYKVAIFPLLANKAELVHKANEVFSNLKNHFNVVFDDRGNIGKRYASQDEIGTPYCVTIDFDTLNDDTVTIRDRDTANQERVPIDKLTTYIKNKLEF